MDGDSFDALTRRASLMALGAGGMATLTGAFAANARKKHKKKGDVNKLCKKQVAPCTSVLSALCSGELECQDSVDCCSFFATCDTTGFWTCFLEAGS